MLEIYSDLASKYGRDNMWVKWFKSELTDINDLEYPSIREYQTAFGKKRPIWARSFRERGIKKEVANNPNIYLDRVVKCKSAWRIEREISRSDESVFVVERTFGMFYEKICLSATLVRIDCGDSIVTVTKNFRVSNKWNEQTLTLHGFDDEKVNTNKLFQFKKPWNHNTFASSVAQSY